MLLTAPAATAMGDATQPRSREQTKRDAAIKKFIQRICTPVSGDKRLHAIEQFFAASQHVVFDATESQHLWKGLFYAIWYTEMGKGCEEIIHTISSACHTRFHVLMAGFNCLATEWGNIDAIRLDKFAFFARNMLRAALRFDVSHSEHRKGHVIRLILDAIRSCLGLLYHITDIYVEELLAVISPIKFKERKEKSLLLHRMLIPFVAIMMTDNDARTLKSVEHDILTETVSALEDEGDIYSLRRYLVRMARTLIKQGARREVHQRNRAHLYKSAELLRNKLSELKHARRHRTESSATKRKSSATEHRKAKRVR